MMKENGSATAVKTEKIFMWRFIGAGSLLSFVAMMVPISTAQDKDKEKDNPVGPVQISWHGQSFFEIKSSKGTVIVTDPHLIPEYGRVTGLKADVVLISHLHNDHTQLDAVENSQSKDIKIIWGLKGFGKNTEWNSVDEKIKDVRIRSLGVYHDDVEGLKFGKNTLFMIEVDGWKIVHLGDLGHRLSREQLKTIGPVDVLMIPVGGIYTINGSEAKDVVEQIKPKEYIFPMHCGTRIYQELLPTDEFLEDVEQRRIARVDDNKISLNRDPQRPRPLIVLLNYEPKKK